MGKKKKSITMRETFSRSTGSKRGRAGSGGGGALDWGWGWGWGWGSGGGGGSGLPEEGLLRFWFWGCCWEWGAAPILPSLSLSLSLLLFSIVWSVIDWIEKLRVRVSLLFSLYLFYIGLFSMFFFVGLINGLLLFLLGLDGLFHSFFLTNVILNFDMTVNLFIYFVKY